MWGSTGERLFTVQTLLLTTSASLRPVPRGQMILQAEDAIRNEEENERQLEDYQQKPPQGKVGDTIDLAARVIPDVAKRCSKRCERLRSGFSFTRLAPLPAGLRRARLPAHPGLSCKGNFAREAGGRINRRSPPIRQQVPVGPGLAAKARRLEIHTVLWLQKLGPRQLDCGRLGLGRSMPMLQQATIAPGCAASARALLKSNTIQTLDPRPLHRGRLTLGRSRAPLGRASPADIVDLTLARSVG